MVFQFPMMKRSRREKSPWLKPKSKPGPKKRKTCEFPDERRKNLPSTSQDYSSSLDLENFEEDKASSETWTIVDRKMLNHALEQSVTCRFCESDGVNFEEVACTGLGAEWVCRCKNLKCSSHQVLASFYTTPKTNRFYDINQEFVLGLRLIGRGYSAAQKVLSVLNLPRPVSNVSWTSHTKALVKAANELLERELKNAVLGVKQHQLENGDLDNSIDGSITVEQLMDVVVDAGVSIDGSWNSRGWSARVPLIPGKFLISFSYPIRVSLVSRRKENNGKGKFQRGTSLAGLLAMKKTATSIMKGVHRSVMNLIFLVKREGKI